MARHARPWWTVLVAVLLATGAHGQEPSVPAEVVITVGEGGLARVEARYALPLQASAELRWLRRPCAVVENLAIDRSGSAVTVEADSMGPWVILRDPSARATGSMRWLITYDVRVTGTVADLPIVHPAVPFPRAEGGEGAVQVTVRFAGDRGSVGFPQMTRDGAEWQAKYVAVPSFVRVSAGTRAGGACDPVPASAAGDGGLTWRFTLLVGIMILWVPLYQLWARRTGASEP